jgi:hypothetical protein
MGDEGSGGLDLGSVAQGSYSNPLYNFAGSIVELTDTEELLLRFEMNLRGEMINNRGEPVKVGESLLNERGVNKIIGIVRSIGSQSSVLSDFERDEVKVLMEYLNDTLAKDLMVNRVNYDIVSPSARDDIVFMSNACAFAILKRGFEGGERRFWKGSQQELTIKGDSQQKKSGGILGLFKK